MREPCRLCTLQGVCSLLHCSHLRHLLVGAAALLRQQLREVGVQEDAAWGRAHRGRTVSDQSVRVWMLNVNA